MGFTSISEEDGFPAGGVETPHPLDMLDCLILWHIMDDYLEHPGIGLIGGSGLINGLMECDYPHIIKGRIIKEKHTITDENRGPNGRLISTEIRETISNRMIFNILTPSGFRSLT